MSTRLSSMCLRRKCWRHELAQANRVFGNTSCRHLQPGLCSAFFYFMTTYTGILSGNSFKPHVLCAQRGFAETYFANIYSWTEVEKS